MSLPIEWIETSKELQSLCDRMQNSEFIALDTEFLREKTYYPKLCLIQVATEKLLACIDPLSIPDLSPLLSLMINKNILKVFHAAGQDLEIFYNMTGTLPDPVFDTQIAAAMLGLGEQISYAALITSVLDIELEKTQSRTDWTRRPLSNAQINYAADDVRYLVKAYLKQRDTLDAMGRREWLATDFIELSNPEQYMIKPDNLLKRVKGRQRLKPRQLAIVRALAIWRENEAMHKDRPRRWILADDVMIDLARRPPTSLDKLADYRGLHEGQIKRSGKEIIGLIQSALELPEDALPAPDRFTKLSRNDATLVDTILAILNLLGNENNIAASVLSSKKEVEALVQGNENSPLLQGWRYQLCGKQIADFLRGEMQLCVVSGQLKLVAVA